MGNNGTKEETEEQVHTSNRHPKPSLSQTMHDSDFEYESKYESPKKLSTSKERADKLRNPYDQRPIELSWLHQNKSHDNHSSMNSNHEDGRDPRHYKHEDRHDYHHKHQRQHRYHHDTHRQPTLAINRWPKDDDSEKQKPKSFIEEYIHQ